MHEPWKSVYIRETPADGLELMFEGHVRAVPVHVTEDELAKISLLIADRRRMQAAAIRLGFRQQWPEPLGLVEPEKLLADAATCQDYIHARAMRLLADAAARYQQATL